MKTMMLGSVLITLLATAKAAAPDYFSYLLLGGSSIAEVGIVLSVAVSLATLIEMYGQRGNNG